MANLGNTTRPAYVYDAETDTWLPIGVGAHTHDYTTQFIGKTLVDAKGDIVTASASDTPAILSKGADGTILVADSTTSTGLAWQPYASPFVAGKNKILNGDMSIWQRGSSISAGSYTADRWIVVGGSGTVSRQTFTPGSAPIAGYEGQYYLNWTITANQQNCEMMQKIEDARTFAGQTVTLSFWVRSTVGPQPQNVYIYQNFGTGGSPSSMTVAGGASYTPTSTWQRISLTVTMPSVAGKTFGTNNDSYLWVRTAQMTTTATNTSLDIWGVQLESGSIATPFTTATGTVQGELAACQRYYFRSQPGATYSSHGLGYGMSTTNAAFQINFPVSMRALSSSVEFSGLAIDQYAVTNFAFTNLTINATTRSVNGCIVETSGSSGLTAYRNYGLFNNNNAAGYLAFSAEL